MWNRLWIGGLIAAMALPVGAQEAAQPPTFFESVDVDVVNLEVFVADRDGRPVFGLDKEAFELTIDGKPREVEYFYSEARPAVSREDRSRQRPSSPTPRSEAFQPNEEAAGAPPTEQQLHIVFYIDNLNLRPTERKRAVKMIRNFIDERLSPSDMVCIVSMNRTPFVHNDFTSDRRILSKILDEVEETAAKDFTGDSQLRRIYRSIADTRSTGARRTEAQAMREANISLALSDIRAYAENQYQNGRISLSGLAHISMSLAGVPGRKALVHVSSGIETRPGEAPYIDLTRNFAGINTEGLLAYDRDIGHYDLIDEFQELGRITNASRVTFYAVDASPNHRALAYSAELQGSLDGGTAPTYALSAMEANIREPVELTARVTGGRRIQLTTTRGDELDPVLDDFGSFYSLGFSVEPGEEVKTHNVEIKVKVDGLRVRHRETYSSRPRDARSVDSVRAALWFNAVENPLNLGVEKGEVVERKDGNRILPLMVTIPLDNVVLLPQGEHRVGQLTLFIATQGENAEARPVQKISLPIAIPNDKFDEMKGESAAYEMPLVIRDGDLRGAITVRDELGASESVLTVDLANV